ncbi:MAG TPA: family 16 glycosylhydrolase [Paludibacter sp.]
MNRLIHIIFLQILSILFVSAQDYKLMWEDNFDKPALDEKQWTIEVQGGNNQELQYYRRENISIEKDASGVNCLVISAKRENYGTRLVTSGRLVTRGKVFCKYGKIEARIKFPNTANGFWPAFWMLGEDFPTVGSPRCGEMDIVEMGSSTGIKRGLQDRYHTAACHWGETLTSYATNNTAAYSLEDDFHLFTLIWDETYIKMYLDLDKYPLHSPYLQMKIDTVDALGTPAHYFKKNYGILLNLAVGGTFTGITGNANIDSITALPKDGTPAKMYVDYVRIYQKNVSGEVYSGPGFTPETTVPSLISATKGAITYNSVELLLKGLDNSGTVYYDITYNGNKVTTNATSGTQLSTTLTGLASGTTYNFSVVAKDASGNVSGSPIIVSATTAPPFNTAKKIDYDNYGYDWANTLFANADCSPTLYSVVDNPDDNGLNYSSHCAKYIVKSTASDWAGVWTSNIGQFTFTSENCKVRLMVNKDVISNFDLKFENSDGSVSVERKVSNTLVNQWEELTFDFSQYIGKTVNRIVIIPDFTTARKVGSVNYWDEISFTNKVVTDNDTEKQIADNVEIYPNPVRNQLHVKADQEIKQVVITTLVGRILKTEAVSNSETDIDLSQIVPGNYMVTVELANGKTSTQKIVKQ